MSTWAGPAPARPAGSTTARERRGDGTQRSGAVDRRRRHQDSHRPRRAGRAAGLLDAGGNPARAGGRTALADPGRAVHPPARRGTHRPGAGPGRGGVRVRRPAGLAGGPGLPAEHPRVARLPAAPAAQGTFPRDHGAAAQRRHLHDGGRALAGRGPGPPLHARRGGVHRRGRRPDPRRAAHQRGDRQRRAYRACRGGPRRAVLLLRRARLPGGDRPGARAGRLGAGRGLAAGPGAGDREGPGRVQRGAAVTGCRGALAPARSPRTGP